jgi:hypothetical protein
MVGVVVEGETGELPPPHATVIKTRTPGRTITAEVITNRRRI